MPATAKDSMRRWVSGAAWVPLIAVSVVALAWLGLVVTGYRPLVVMSGSMAPALVPGDVVVVSVVPASEAKPGDIVSFRDPSRSGELVTHRVVGKARTGETVAFMTRGDRNTGVEQWSVSTAGTIGRVSLRVPAIGRALVWLGRRNVRALLFAGSLIALALVALQFVWQLGRFKLPKPAVLVLVASLGLAVGARSLPETFSAFSAMSSNTANHFAAASQFCTTPGSVTVTSVADSYVDQAGPTTNNGGESPLFVQSLAGANRRSLVRFGLPVLPSGCTVTSATLRMMAVNFQPTYVYQVYRAATSWAENTVTWNDQPASAGSASTANTTSGWIQWTVTSQLQTMYSGSNFGFLVKDSVEDAGSTHFNSYQSREGSNPPQLVVNYG